MNQSLRELEKYVKKVMSKESAHDFKHADRVRNWAIEIAKQEGFRDLDMVEAAALLHDIGLPSALKNNQHGVIGAKLAQKFLSQKKYLDKKKIDQVCEAIKFHNKNREGRGKLLMILRDADMIDLFGAVGIMRGIISKSRNPEYNPENIKSNTWQMRAMDFDKLFDSGVGVGRYIVDQINFQISCYDNLRTNFAKKIAKPLVDDMINFVRKLEVEILRIQK